MAFGRREEVVQALASVGEGGYVRATDVTLLRQSVFKDGIVSAEELNALFELGERAPEGDAEWAHFFAEAAADFYLREEEPHGYFTDIEFLSLKERVTRDGGDASALEVELLVRLLETAVETPAAMTDFVAAQIRAAISAKAGGARVSAEDAVLIRRYIFAAGGAGNVAITRSEAEFLFDIADLTAGAKNDAAWTELFVKAIANHLLAHIGYAPPSRENARATQTFMTDRTVNVRGFFKRMIEGSLSGLRQAPPSTQAQRNAERKIEAAAAEIVTGAEADWVADRIGRDGALHPAERALIDHLRGLGAELPPKLKAIIGA